MLIHLHQPSAFFLHINRALSSGVFRILLRGCLLRQLGRIVYVHAHDNIAVYPNVAPPRMTVCKLINGFGGFDKYIAVYVKKRECGQSTCPRMPGELF